MTLEKLLVELKRQRDSIQSTIQMIEAVTTNHTKYATRQNKAKSVLKSIRKYKKRAVVKNHKAGTPGSSWSAERLAKFRATNAARKQMKEIEQ
jgi:hypothetical protein